MLLLVISANTHRIWLVSLPQAKLTWLGSETTFGFWQAVAISLFTVATLGGHDGPCLNMIIAPMTSTTRPAADAMAILRPRRERRCQRRRGRCGRGCAAPVDEHPGPVLGRAPPVLRDGPGVPGRGPRPASVVRPGAPWSGQPVVRSGFASVLGVRVLRRVALRLPPPRRFGELASPRLPPLRKLLLQIDGPEFHI